MIFRIFATLALLALIGGSLLLGRQSRDAEVPAPRAMRSSSRQARTVGRSTR
jgi:hypothetical protein